MKTSTLLTALAAVGGAISAVFAGPSGASADLRVVATVADLGTLAREIGGSHATVTILALPTQDPHFVDARPNLALELSRADLLLTVGLDLEVGWLPTLQIGARNGRIQRGAQGFLDCSGLVTTLEVPSGPIERSMGDIHPGGSPHYTLDPRAMENVARGIARRMGELDVPNAAEYRGRADAFIGRLRAHRARWEQTLAPLRGAPVIGYHRSWAYLASWLGVRVVEHLEPRPGIPPTPAHVARVLAIARRDAVRLILQEAYYADRTARVIEERSGARLVRIAGGADFAGGQSYIQRIDQMVRALSRAWQRAESASAATR